VTCGIACLVVYLEASIASRSLPYNNLLIISHVDSALLP
jgi:hypothetical protein